MNIGDVVVHNYDGLLKVVDITIFDGVKYFVLEPSYSNDKLNQSLLPENIVQQVTRLPISKELARQIINSISTYINLRWIDDIKNRKTMFKDILDSGNPEEISKIIYLIKTKEYELKQIKKTLSKVDQDSLYRAESLLYAELAYSLNTSINEIKSFYRFNGL